MELFFQEINETDHLKFTIDDVVFLDNSRFFISSTEKFDGVLNIEFSKLQTKIQLSFTLKQWLIFYSEILEVISNPHDTAVSIFFYERDLSQEIEMKYYFDCEQMARIYLYTCNYNDHGSNIVNQVSVDVSHESIAESLRLLKDFLILKVGYSTHTFETIQTMLYIEKSLQKERTVRRNIQRAEDKWLFNQMYDALSGGLAYCVIILIFNFMILFMNSGQIGLVVVGIIYFFMTIAKNIMTLGDFSRLTEFFLIKKMMLYKTILIMLQVILMFTHFENEYLLVLNLFTSMVICYLMGKMAFKMHGKYIGNIVIDEEDIV